MRSFERESKRQHSFLPIPFHFMVDGARMLDMEGLTSRTMDAHIHIHIHIHTPGMLGGAACLCAGLYDSMLPSIIALGQTHSRSQ